MSELEQYKERLRMALSAAKICIFEVDLVKQLYTFFENAQAIFGVSDDTILQDVRPYSALDPEAYRLAVSAYFSHPEDADVIEAAFEEILNGRQTTYEARMKAGGSAFTWCEIHVAPIMEKGKPVRMVGVITDISDIKAKTDRLKQAVHLDDFTGLYRKGYTITRIKEALREGLHGESALIVLDIDYFKSFNDTYGHDEGDKIIKAISLQIKKAFRETAIIGRFGGDEFIIFVRDLKDKERLREKLKYILRVTVDGFVCTTSIGVACCPTDAKSFDDLFKKADLALYKAKSQKGTVIYFQEIDQR